ncbi:ABC transporter ATP-binding protein [Francisella frigiditurris]|uniref:Spermidine/putrescine import ATP-binding protein PotA n=1 Tax=Francisella frigiditurris TaxID=1542390 RepID=A0A1J0KUW6_9GAMM|nr:ABC transporter ATP-binding protein [Francisella frigiditurris]APC97608.1 polyamine ABC transporter, ATP-binding family protein [Francisella frigiditurris]
MSKTPKKPLVTIKNLSKQFDDGHLAVDSINLDVYPKEFFSLLGGSGSGKSTLLRMLAGFEKPTDGKIIIDGVDMSNIPPYKRPVNMMFQSYALFPHMTIKQNIMFGLKQDRLPKEDIEKRTNAALKIIKMEHLAKRKPHQLSGGQRQRVALARCLAKRPKLILLDEPLSALDKNLRDQMQFELVDIQEQTGSTFIMVTHDQEEAMTMSTRIGIMSDGWLEQVSPPSEIYEFPKSKFVANFIGKSAIFEGRISKTSKNKSVIESDEAKTSFILERNIDGVEDQEIWVGLRPEKIFIDKEKPEDYDPKKPVNCIKGVVEDIAYLGGLSTYHVRTEGGKIVKSTDFNIERNADHPSWGDEVYLTWESQNIMVLYS